MQSSEFLGSWENISPDPSDAEQNKLKSSSNVPDSREDSETNGIAAHDSFYAYIEDPVSSKTHQESLPFYIDLRVEPPSPIEERENKIVIGSRVVFIGATRWLSEEGKAVFEPGIPDGANFHVAHIFDDHWALFIKLDAVLEPCKQGIYRKFTSCILSSKPRGKDTDTALVAVKPHPVNMIYAPLAAFTLLTNYPNFEANRAHVEAWQPGLATWEGGYVKAAERTSSSIYEKRAKLAEKLFIPAPVYLKTKSHQKNPSGSDAPFSSQVQDRKNKNVGTKKARRLVKPKAGTLKDRSQGTNVPNSGPADSNPSGLPADHSNFLPGITPQVPFSNIFNAALSMSADPLLVAAQDPTIIQGDPNIPAVKESPHFSSSDNIGSESDDLISPAVNAGRAPMEKEVRSGTPINANHTGFEVGGISPSFDPLERENNNQETDMNQGAHKSKAKRHFSSDFEQGEIEPVYDRRRSLRKSLSDAWNELNQWRRQSTFPFGWNEAPQPRGAYRAHAEPIQETPNTVGQLTSEGAEPGEASDRRRSSVRKSLSSSWNQLKIAHRRSILPVDSTGLTGPIREAPENTE